MFLRSASHLMHSGAKFMTWNVTSPIVSGIQIRYNCSMSNRIMYMYHYQPLHIIPVCFYKGIKCMYHCCHSTEYRLVLKNKVHVPLEYLFVFKNRVHVPLPAAPDNTRPFVFKSKVLFPLPFTPHNNQLYIKIKVIRPLLQSRKFQ